MNSFVSAIVAALLGLAYAAASAADCSTHPARYPTECCNFTAPQSFSVIFTTDVGNFTLESKRSWAPYGVDRFYSLLQCHYFDGSQEGIENNAAFFRVVPSFVVQWGIAGVPAVSAAWENLIIPNDPVVLSNTAGTFAFAAAMDPVSGLAVNRTTQVYINTGNNSRLDAMGFAPVAQLVGLGDLDVVNSIVSKWGEEPDQDAIYAQGDAYLQKKFPGLTYVSMTVL